MLSDINDQFTVGVFRLGSAFQRRRRRGRSSRAAPARERSGGSPDEGTSPPSFRNGAIGEVVRSRGYVRRRISPSSSFLRLTSLSLHSPRVEGFDFGYFGRFEAEDEDPKKGGDGRKTVGGPERQELAPASTGRTERRWTSRYLARGQNGSARTESPSWDRAGKSDVALRR